MRLSVLLGFGFVAFHLISCATGGKFAGGGGSSGDGGGSSNDGGSGGQMTTTAPTTGGGGATTSATTMEACAETPCKLVAPQCGCAPEEMCAINGTGDRECHSEGMVPPGEECASLFACAAGSLCLKSSDSKSFCKTYCDSDAQCNGGLCLIQLLDPSDPANILPDVTLCSDDCDPVTSSGCPAGASLGCQIGQQPDGDMKTFTICSGAGNGAQGASCTDNTDCAAGSGCFTVGGVQKCLKYCLPPNGACPASSACGSFDPPLIYNGTEYGACVQ